MFSEKGLTPTVTVVAMAVGDGTFAISVLVAFIAELQLRQYWRRRYRALKEKEKIRRKEWEIKKDRGRREKERETFLSKVSL